LEGLKETLQNRTTGTATSRRLILASVAIASLLALYLLFFKSSASVQRESLRIAKVEQISGRRIAFVSGRIVAERPVTVSAAVPGRVERLALEPGARAAQGDLLLELTNRTVLDSQLAASATLAEGILQAEKAVADMQIQVIDKRGLVSDLRARAEIARRQQQADRQLADDRIISEINASKSKYEAESAARKVEEAEQSLRILEGMLANVRMAGDAQTDRLKAAAALREAEVESLKVRVPIGGIVQEVAVTQGQEVTAGTILAKMYDPAALSVLLDVPERQAANVETGHAAIVTIAGTQVRGKVVKVSPVVKDGLVAVEVRLDDEMPAGARPELRVEAEIYADTSARMIVVNAPEGVRPASKAEVFVVVGDRGYRRRASFGAQVGNRIEVLDGLRPGEAVIVGGLDEYAEYDELDLK
jgi:multidrug resistance efflux pump